MRALWKARLDYITIDTEYHSMWELGVTSIQAGEIDLAFEYLEKSFELREPAMVYIRTNNPFAWERDDPRYQDIVDRMNFPPVPENSGS